MIGVKRALLSCSDKTGLEAFAKSLAAAGVELIASGGTAELLKKQGLAVTSVEQFAGISEQLDGRVKTLHPKIHAGILARRDDPAHMKAVGEAGRIDLVAVNLYPFEATVQRQGVAPAEAVEQIDIGGVALLRAAAKNFAHVLVVSHPRQYVPVAEALRQGRGQAPEALASQLAVEAFALTSRYDTWIAGYLASAASGHGPVHGAALPERLTVSVQQRQPLRYGENPHQRGAWYAGASDAPWGLGTLEQLQGKELSYNNLLDMDAALRCLMDFETPACAIIKHNSQCGVACAASAEGAYAGAYACDPESAFGGIVGLNRPVTAALAEQLGATFLEVILAPAVEPSALAILAKKANLRVVTIAWPSSSPGGMEWRQLSGGWLIQDADWTLLPDAPPKAVTKRAPSDAERRDLLFAWTAAKHVKSNAIVLAAGQATVGIGQGQPSRVGAVRVAIEKAGAKAKGTVAASDGFFPFPDGLTLLAKAGVTAVIQPGGSIRDAEVIGAADQAGIAMWLTGVRHFKH